MSEREKVGDQNGMRYKENEGGDSIERICLIENPSMGESYKEGLSKRGMYRDRK